MQTTLSEPSRVELPRWLDLVSEQVSELRFGIVQLTVHEGQVVQVERTERIRLAPNSVISPREK